MCILGAGRNRVDSEIDHAVGMKVHKKIADYVQAGEPLCTLFYNDNGRHKEACSRLHDSYRFSAAVPERPTLIRKVIFEGNEM